MRNWLKQKEVYFTTVCSVILSLTAIYVSIISYVVADRQMEMDYFEKLPDFQVTRNQIFDEKMKRFETVELVVNKLSGKAKNINIETVTILDVEYSDINPGTKKSRFLVEDYFNTNFLTGKTEGVIQTITGHRNQFKAYELEKKIESRIEIRNQYVSTRWQTYMQITYLNFENKDQVEYFDASSVSGKLIRNDSLARYFDFKHSPIKADQTIHLNDLEEEEKFSKLISKIQL
ncbi:hypothetical protein [Pedobacter nyackensis]|uniref:hypothetical protein n=1 Tax=Pedobacter nyackensis TaxID=475255 RepID=UPI00292E4456|nr:hypothetical protein [Pedobacter nyackensis]